MSVWSNPTNYLKTVSLNVELLLRALDSNSQWDRKKVCLDKGSNLGQQECLRAELSSYIRP